jgi:hypothetical protein
VAAPFVKSPTVAFAPDAPEEVARADAARKMIVALLAVRTRGAATVGDLVKADDKLLGRLDELARAYEVRTTRRFSDGGLEIAARVSLDAALGVVSLPLPAAPPASAPAPGAGGLVVDATAAKDFVPCVLPALATAAGVMLADGGAATGWRYAGSPKAARALLGDPKAPGVKATGVLAGDPGVLTLPAAEAAKLETFPGAAEALRAGRVVIVAGKPKKK